MPKQDHPWYKKRNYLHFDLPVKIRNAEIIATSPSKVQRHSFYPFIAYDIASKKIKKCDHKKTLQFKHKLRPVSYAAHVDSHIYTYYAYLLNIAYEKHIIKLNISENVLAFRKLGKSNIDFANDTFNEIIKRKNCVAIAFDVTGFFDNLNHDILKESWCEILGTQKLPEDHYSVFKSLTKFSKVNKNQLYETFSISKKNPKNDHKRICTPYEFRQVVRNSGMIRVNRKKKGIPQGSPISALLSNIYMSTFDKEISILTNNLGGRYYRYCDDILCIVSEETSEEVEETVLKKTQDLKLDINTEKTKTSSYKFKNGKILCDKPLQYLGFIFDGNHKLIRSAALARFSERMKSGVKLAKMTKRKFNRIRLNKGIAPKELYKRKIYEKYSHLGRQNFIRYGLRSAEIMKSKAIKKQLKPLWNRLTIEIEK